MQKGEVKDLFKLNSYAIRERQGYLLECSQKLIEYIHKKYEINQLDTIVITPNELDKLGVVHNRHGIEINLHVEDGNKNWGGLALPYFLNGGDNSIAYIKEANDVTLRHELIHCLDFIRYLKNEKVEKKDPHEIQTTAENIAFKEHNFVNQLRAFTYLFDVFECFSCLANIEDELYRDGESRILKVYDTCFSKFKDGLSLERPTCMDDLKENFPAICIYNEACLFHNVQKGGEPHYFIPRVLENTNITKDNFFTEMTDEQFNAMRKELYEYLLLNWKMIKNATLQMQKS